MVLGRSNPKMNRTTHEDFSRGERVAGGSDRSFGFVMAAALGTLTVLNAWHSGRLWQWTGGLSVVFFSTGLLWPSALNPLNRTWLKFGEILHNIVNPIVMALLFYATVLPTGLVMRALGKDLLRLKRQAGLESYWIVRAPAGPAPETMKDQF
jgi:Saxitoxin biosynthesis operon protein SxtJ